MPTAWGHALNRYWGTLYTNGASMDMPGYYHPIILNSEFINSKLTAKVIYWPISMIRILGHSFINIVPRGDIN